jgi:protein-disulfide isomerase
MRSCTPRLAGILRNSLFIFAALVVSAQDWKTTDSLPRVDFAGLSAEQKTTALKVLRDTGCSCGCSMKLAECRVVDPNCAYSTNLAQVVVNELKAGKSEANVRAALDASPWAHPKAPKMLEDPVKIPVAGAPSLGPENAPITLVEFSDFQCPYCAAAVPAVHAVLQAYPTQLRLVFKEYPLEIHPRANFAASAAVAAQRQGKFWEMHNALYGSQRDLSREAIFTMAQKAGLDMKKFEADLQSTDVAESIVRDVQDGDAAGVEGTPSFFINGQKFNGPMDLSVLRPILDAELKGQPVAKIN